MRIQLIGSCVGEATVSEKSQLPNPFAGLESEFKFVLLVGPED
jgi:hypothetical protein